ncbi:hypothetical protein BC828DRAFT_3224 [Blastocladiella britannica]|nr:hypothetical protein BC828DRAFT_3224 [Blastocladiella britannica]
MIPEIPAAKRTVARVESLSAPTTADYDAAMWAYLALIRAGDVAWLSKYSAFARMVANVYVARARARAPLDEFADDRKALLAWLEQWYITFIAADGLLFSTTTEPNTGSVELVSLPPLTAATLVVGPRPALSLALNVAALAAAAEMARTLAAIYATSTSSTSSAAICLDHARVLLTEAVRLDPGAGKLHRTLATVIHSARSPSGNTLTIGDWAISVAYHLARAEAVERPDGSGAQALWDRVLEPFAAAEAASAASAAAVALDRSHPLAFLVLQLTLRLYTRTKYFSCFLLVNLVINNGNSLDRVPGLAQSLASKAQYLPHDQKTALFVWAIATQHTSSHTSAVPYALAITLALASALRPPSRGQAPDPRDLLHLAAILTRGVCSAPNAAWRAAGNDATVAGLVQVLNKLQKVSSDLLDAGPQLHASLVGLDPDLYPFPVADGGATIADVIGWWASWAESWDTEQGSPAPVSVKDGKLVLATALTSLGLEATALAFRPIVLNGATALPARLIADAEDSTPSSNLRTAADARRHFVFDTNLLLQSLADVNCARVPAILVPLVVIRELRGLTRSDDPDKAQGARTALAWLFPAAPEFQSNVAPLPPPPSRVPIVFYSTSGTRVDANWAMIGAEAERTDDQAAAAAGELVNLDARVLATCTAIAKTMHVTPLDVVLVTQDLNLRLLARSEGVGVCDLSDLVGAQKSRTISQQQQRQQRGGARRQGSRGAARSGRGSKHP